MDHKKEHGMLVMKEEKELLKRSGNRTKGIKAEHSTPRCVILTPRRPNMQQWVLPTEHATPRREIWKPRRPKMKKNGSPTDSSAPRCEMWAPRRPAR